MSNYMSPSFILGTAKDLATTAVDTAAKVPAAVASKLPIQNLDMPQLKVPTVTLPEMKLPEMKLPEIKMPEVSVPSIDVNAVKVSAVETATKVRQNVEHTVVLVREAVGI